jgi:peptidoglycan/xylan/chitin deacetylase (PgdA/CDA1 family)
VAVAAMFAACQADIAELDGVFYNGDGRLVHCGVDLDTTAKNTIASVDTGLDRARDRGEVVELYAHHPGVTVPVSKIEHVLAGAHDRGLAFFTYADFAAGRPVGPGLALSFDDTFVDAWVDLLPTFARYGAQVTFFVSRYAEQSAEQHAGLHQLAAAGHDIEAHSVKHLRAPEYVEDYGLDSYLHDEMDPSIQILRDNGFEVHAFAYPFGARTGELDRAIGERVPVVRSVAFSYDITSSPCPR